MGYWAFSFDHLPSMLQIVNVFEKKIARRVSNRSCFSCQQTPAPLGKRDATQYMPCIHVQWNKS